MVRGALEGVNPEEAGLALFISDKIELEEKNFHRATEIFHIVTWQEKWQRPLFT
jgi:hypothetical protein